MLENCIACWKKKCEKVKFQNKMQAEVVTHMAPHGQKKAKSAKILVKMARLQPQAPRMKLVVKAVRPKPKPATPLQSLPEKRKYRKKAEETVRN